MLHPVTQITDQIRAIYSILVEKTYLKNTIEVDDKAVTHYNF